MQKPLKQKTIRENLEDNMKKDSILNGVIRHILTAGGGALVAKGVVAETEIEALVGALITIIGVVWSALAKKKKE
jgi:hypothetical protein|tara:strand:- start:6335 stop:6559 length:225 start_codon:yes stop_codon:yes gene_type:complete